MKDPRDITPAEFEILEVLWDRDEALSVSQVLQSVNEKRNVAYTTIMTLLDKMARKGSVRRAKKGKAYFYLPKVMRSQVVEFLLGNFVETYCGGERRRLARFLDSARMSSPTTAPSGRKVQEKIQPRPDSGFEESDEMDVVLL